MNNPTHCDLCGEPLDAYALAVESGYCSTCADPIGSFYEVLNYFLLPIQTSPLKVAEILKGFQGPHGKDAEKPGEDGMVTVPWPFPKNPSLWHEKACRLFPKWRTVVEEFKILKGIKTFDTEALRSLIDYLVEEKGRSPEAVAAMRREDIVNIIKNDIIQKSLTQQLSTEETGADPLPSWVVSAPQAVQSGE